MADVARAAGVAQSTVSRILNRAPEAILVTEATRERVLAAAQRLDYRPNPLARALRGAPTMLIGAIVRDVTDPFFAVAIDALASTAAGHGYSLVLGHARSRADEALALAAVLEARQCDAILLLGDFREEPMLIDDLRQSQVPVVAMWHGSRIKGFHSVTVDNRAGIRDALDHLSGLGHRRIAFVGGESLGDIREREEAYREYFGETDIVVPDSFVQRASNTFLGPGPALERLLRSPEPPTALMAATDVLGAGLIHAAVGLGLRVPDDLSIVGFDDIPFAAATVPALTTVHMPVAEMSAAAVELALSPDRDPTDRETRILTPTLVTRSSTAPPPLQHRLASRPAGLSHG